MSGGIMADPDYVAEVMEAAKSTYVPFLVALSSFCIDDDGSLQI